MVGRQPGGDDQSLAYRIAHVLFATRAVSLCRQYPDDRQQCQEHDQKFKGQIAGDADRGQRIVAELANHHLGGQEHREL